MFTRLISFFLVAIFALAGAVAQAKISPALEGHQGFSNQLSKFSFLTSPVKVWCDTRHRPELRSVGIPDSTLHPYEALVGDACKFPTPVPNLPAPDDLAS